MGKWQLRFAPAKVHALVQEYEQQLANRNQQDDEAQVMLIGQQARQAGQFGYESFLTVCKWKTLRSQSRCRKNTPEEVSEITGIALSTRIERLRIEVLRCLHGVDWPTASVLLHIAHVERYPILDRRALWSWGFDKAPLYTFDFWWEYVVNCRELAEKLQVNMRTVDRALWQYSKDHQEPLQ